MSFQILTQPPRCAEPAFFRIAGETTSAPRRAPRCEKMCLVTTLYPLAALGTLSRSAGEGGPSAQRWVGEGLAVARHTQSLAALFSREAAEPSVADEGGAGCAAT